MSTTANKKSGTFKTKSNQFQPRSTGRTSPERIDLYLRRMDKRPDLLIEQLHESLEFDSPSTRYVEPFNNLPTSYDLFRKKYANWEPSFSRSSTLIEDFVDEEIPEIQPTQLVIEDIPTEKVDQDSQTDPLEEPPKPKHVSFTAEQLDIPTKQSKTEQLEDDTPKWRSDIKDVIMQRYYSGNKWPYHKTYGYYKSYGAAGKGAKTSSWHKYPGGFAPPSKPFYSTGTSKGTHK